jgi:hypothetical protein
MMDSYRIRNIGAVELDAIHNRLKTHFLAAGLKGVELDYAIAAAFRSSLISIDNDRDAKAQAKSEKQAKRAHLKVVVE